eukprot:jgi/Botrbrau1/6648/Bobra.104_2s0035.1
MPREFITLQVGQCGNQIGSRFWDLALKEHDVRSKEHCFRDSMASFFNCEEPTSSSGNGQRLIPPGVKARAVLVDMEEGVVNQVMKGRLRSLFEGTQLITDVSGAGNNWAHGARLYGPRYRDRLLEAVRQQVERCDALQSFLLLHSLGGGTGSGLGSFLLALLQDEFPGVFRITASVFPSEEDDVVTSPYNSTLSAAVLAEHADAVVCLENQALLDIWSRLSSAASSSSKPQYSTVPASGEKKRGAFDGMNGLAAQSLLNMTAGVRFPGTLNVDLNEITTNLVAFPRLHFLQPAMSPLMLSRDVRQLAGEPRSLDQMFSEVFQQDHQLMSTDLYKGTLLGTALLMRGNISISDASRNVERLQGFLPFPHWHPKAFKLGLCQVPPSGSPYSLFNLANNTSIASALSSLHGRFSKLYKRRFFLHHYEEYMERSEMGQAADCVASVVEQYESLHRATSGLRSPLVTRMQPLGLSFAPG